jgi:hypothetical protein
VGLEERLRRLETSLALKSHVDTGAPERIVAKLMGMAERHRAARKEGLEPDLEQQSIASLCSMVLSFPPGEVPTEVATALKYAVHRMEYGSLSSSGRQLARRCLKAGSVG